MPVNSEHRVHVECDGCGNMITDAGRTQKEAVAEARLQGWSIGIQVTCHECLEAASN